MSEFTISKLCAHEERGAMNSCYKFCTWINHTLLMLLLQIFWKISQITDFFKERPIEEDTEKKVFVFTPLTKESKHRRHIRSMSDVQSSTPYRLSFKPRRGSSYTLSYDSDCRHKRHLRLRQADSSDSSDSEQLRKNYRIESNILKRADSMRVL